MTHNLSHKGECKIECGHYHELNSSEWCIFAHEETSCELDDVYIQYMEVFLCGSDSQSYIVGWFHRKFPNFPWGQL